MALARRSEDLIADVQALARAVAVLQRALARGTLPVGDGAPADEGQPDGSVYVQRTPPRAHFRVGGAWLYVDLLAP